MDDAAIGDIGIAATLARSSVRGPVGRDTVNPVVLLPTKRNAA